VASALQHSSNYGRDCAIGNWDCPWSEGSSLKLGKGFPEQIESSKEGGQQFARSHLPIDFSLASSGRKRGS